MVKKNKKLRTVGFTGEALPVTQRDGLSFVDFTGAKVAGSVVPLSDVRVEGSLPRELYLSAFVAMFPGDAGNKYFNATARSGQNNGKMFLRIGRERETGNYAPPN